MQCDRNGYISHLQMPNYYVSDANKNLHGCSEILKTTLELDIPLDDTYNQKLIHLLTGGKFTYTLKKDTTPKFNFKF